MEEDIYLKNLNLKNTTKIAKWQLFSIGKVLNVTRPKITKLKNLNKNRNNNISRISASILNNGIQDFYSNPPANKGQVIIVNTVAKPFFFYEAFDFLTTGDIAQIESDFKMNERIGLFLSCIMDHAITYSNGEKSFDFGYSLTIKRIKHIKIQLPINIENYIDFSYMDNFIGDLLSDYKMPQIEPVGDSKISLSAAKWKSFKIVDVFDVKTENFISRSEQTKGSTPFVSTFSTNNGIKGFVDVEPDKNNIYKNFVSVSTEGLFGKCFYQEAPAVISNGAVALINKHLNKYNGMFIATVLRNSIEQSLWYRKSIKSNLRTQQINLPVDYSGKVDWNFMEKYILSIPNSNLIQKTGNHFLKKDNKIEPSCSPFVARL